MTTKENRSTTHSLIHIEPFELDHLGIDEFFTTKFDYVVKREMYKPYKKTLAIYDFLRQIFVNSDKNISTPIVTLSPDPSISASTLAGSAEKFMCSDIDPKTNSTIFTTNLKVLYFDSSPDISVQKYDSYDSFRESVLSDVMGLNKESFSLHRINIPPENIIIIGIDENNIDDTQENTVKKHGIDMFSSDYIRKKGIVKFMKKIIKSVQNDDVHVVIDLSCIQQKFASSSIRNKSAKSDSNNGSGFDYDEMIVIMNYIKKLEKLNGLDITGYNFGSIQDKNKHHVSNILTVKTIEMIVGSIIVLKQKSINIFNENSKFLIWRKVHDADPIGWYILRGVSLQDREQIIKSIDDGQIITIAIPENDDNNDNDNIIDNVALVAVTTMKEQQEKSYYTSSILQDCCLYPGEKLNMMFELLNTPNVQQAQSKEYSDINRVGAEKEHYIQYVVPGNDN